MSSWYQCARSPAYPLHTGIHGRGLPSEIVFSSVAYRTWSKCGGNLRIIMRDRSKNRKPLQKGRNLSIEAIQAVQALKRVANKNDDSAVELMFNSKVRRLIKSDMIAVLRELLRQNQCLLALKVFEEVQKEISYRPQLKLYAEIVSCLGSNGLLEDINCLIMALKMESSLEPDIEGFYALLESLMKFNLTRLALEVFYLMKLRGCDPDKLTFKLLINGLESNEETNLSAFVRREAEKSYGQSLDFLDETEEEVPGLKPMKRAESDDTVPDAPTRAEKFAQRYAAILEDLKKDPESHGGPPDCILLCRLREQVLREVGFRDIFKKVKDEENVKAISLFKDVVCLNDAIEDEAKRVENLVRGIFAGNIFDLGSAKLAELFSEDGMSFLASCQNLVPQPWVIDDLDIFITKWSKKTWKKAVIFVDNSGADIVLGILPFARELLRHGVQVVLAANDLPSINDVTYPELVEILSKLKDEHGKLIGVDTSNLLVANSGNDLPVIDLTTVSQELAYLASDADLVILEGMGRGIETNLYARFKCDSLKIGMVKHQEVAQFLGGRLYDCVFKFNEASS